MRHAGHYAARILASLLLMLTVPAGRALAVTTLEGYSSFMTVLRSSGGGDPTWEFSKDTQLYAELRVKTSPWRNIDSFLKMSAESDRWVETPQIKDTRFFFKEAHIHFRAERVEGHLFTGQNRFWLNEPLLEIVNQDVVKQDNYGPRAQGVRLDFWNVYGIYGAAFLSERSDYQSKLFKEIQSEAEFYPGYTLADTITLSTDDYRAFRLNRALASDRVLLGATYARKDYTLYGDNIYHGRHQDFDETVAFDTELALGELVPALSRFGRMTLVTEVGRNTSGWLWEIANPAANGFKTELRETKLGPLKFVGAYESYGEHFYGPGLASNDRQNLDDYTVAYGEARYRVPTKAVNLRGWARHAAPKHPELTSYSQSVGTANEWGTGAYVEFVNGFTGSVEYKVYEDRNGTWPNLFFEVTGENKLVKLRTQFRIKDIDSPFEVTAYGFEANVNLSESWKFYSRVMNVDEQTQSRQTAFAQLRYLAWSGGEFFVEFGNPDQSNDLVNDNDFVGHDMGATTEKVFKAFVRIYY